MGILDKKERVLDVVLTDKGRDLLSKNQLDFTFYAFSDEGVDYSGALTASLLTSGSIDDYVRQTFTFEAPQYKNSKDYEDLKTFLYTVPERRRTLPEFVTNFDGRPDISAYRRFFIDTFSISARVRNVVQNPIGVVLRTTQNKTTLKNKLESYIIQQKVLNTQERLESRKSVVGHSIGKNAVLLSPTRVLETTTGKVYTTERWEQIREQKSNNVNVLSVSKDVEIITGLDRIKLDFTLKSSEGTFPANSGYLIEVFESGSDGVLTKLFEENVVDVLEEDVLQKGFSKDLFVDVDVEVVELIKESARLRRQQLRKRALEEQRARRELQKQINRTTFSEVPPRNSLPERAGATTSSQPNNLPGRAGSPTSAQSNNLPGRGGFSSTGNV